MPRSSLRSSGWRATAWIIEPKMLPMPTPAPSAPRPIPSARAIALPASAPASAAARKKNEEFMVGLLLGSVLGLDGRADVDGGQGGEDIRLDGDDDQGFEEVEKGGGRYGDKCQEDVLEHDDEPDEREDEHVACEHVRVEADREADQAHELAQDLERDDQRQHRLRHVGNPALEVAPRPVCAYSLDVSERPGHERQRERDRESRGRRKDRERWDFEPEDRHLLIGEG